MKNLSKLLVVVALGVPALAFGGVVNSKHDLSENNTNVSIRAATSTTTQTCVFCHTPHMAQAQLLLWNRTGITGDRGWSGGSTTKGTDLPTNLTDSSKSCLTCHDGTVALGQLANVNGATANFAMASGTGKSAIAGAYLIFSTGTGGSQYNHPVSVAFPGESAAYYGNTSAAVTGDYEYHSPTNSSCETSTGICTDGPNGGYITIYQDTSTGARGVECGSCHDVHNRYGLSFFLRVSPDQSALCLACHNK